MHSEMHLCTIDLGTHTDALSHGQKNVEWIASLGDTSKHKIHTYESHGTLLHLNKKINGAISALS